MKPRLFPFLFLALLPMASLLAEGFPEIRMREQPFFPIVGFEFLWHINERLVQEKAEMGLTLLTLHSAEELDWCAAAGLKGIVYQPQLDRFLHSPSAPEMATELQKAVDAVKGHPAFYGMQYTDEPSKRVMEGYAKAYGILKQSLGDALVYTCLFPSWATSVQHGYPDYEQYLEEFCSLYAAHPGSVLCYDNYRNKDPRLPPRERLASYLDNLEIVRKISQRHGMPFWTTVLCAAHDHFQDPTQADLDFEVFSSLAYGAKGIGYFTTSSHQNNIFQGGPFTFLGDKTPIFWHLRDLNFRVRKLAPALTQLESTGCYYALLESDKPFFQKFPSFRPLPGELVETLQAEYGDCSFLVGEFRDKEGSRWLLVVNLNLETPAHFQVTLRNGAKLQHFNSYMGYLYPPQVQDTWLRPGQGKLYKVLPSAK